MSRNNPLRNLFNELRWNPSQERSLDRSEMIVGDYLDERGYTNVPLCQVLDVLSGGVEVLGDAVIPYHRIIEVRCGDDRVYENSVARRKYSSAA
ncbi:MAG: hypothetical protein ABIH52_01280 [Candidatus Aenigmatarchaeota archaeon]